MVGDPVGGSESASAPEEGRCSIKVPAVKGPDVSKFMASGSFSKLKSEDEKSEKEKEMGDELSTAAV